MEREHARAVSLWGRKIMVETGKLEVAEIWWEGMLSMWQREVLGQPGIGTCSLLAWTYQSGLRHWISLLRRDNGNLGLSECQI